MESHQYLIRSGAANKTDVEVARARFEKASADWSAMQQRLSGCQILAPFDGSVVELSATAFETPPINKPLMVITSADQLEIEIIVLSRDLVALQPGKDIVFTIDETAGSYRARILRTGGAIDTVSQTAKVYAAFRDVTGNVLPGMSGTASPESGAR